MILLFEIWSNDFYLDIFKQTYSSIRPNELVKLWQICQVQMSKMYTLTYSCSWLFTFCCCCLLFVCVCVVLIVLRQKGDADFYLWVYNSCFAVTELFAADWPLGITKHVSQLSTWWNNAKRRVRGDCTWWPFSSLAKNLGECSTIHSSPALFLSP